MQIFINMYSYKTCDKIATEKISYKNIYKCMKNFETHILCELAYHHSVSQRIIAYWQWLLIISSLPITSKQ